VVAVSSRPQTTRRRALGAVQGDGWQMVLVDLPGVQKPFDRLTERMQRSVEETLADADAVVLVLNGPEGVGPGDRHIASTVFRAGAPPCVIAVNKTDVMRPAAIAETIAAAAQLGDFHAIHPISARTGPGVEELAADLAALMPEGPAYFPEGITTDQTVEQRVAEAIREVALEALRQEVPHAIAVLVEEIAPGRKGVTVVQAILICETQSQKRILVGSGGAMIRRIGTGARPLVESLVGGPVFLDLTVKVRPRWRRDEAELDRLGI
jgi:GTP-binding protein Era